MRNTFHAGVYYSHQIAQLQKSNQAGQRMLMKALFDYYTGKRYKREGFGCFSEAYYRMQAFGSIPYSVATLRKYFSVFRAFQAAGITVEELCRFPISRLIKLKKHVATLETHQIRQLLWMDQENLNHYFTKEGWS